MNLLQAAAGQPQQPSPWGFYIMIGLMILVLWLFMWRPESKRRKEMQKFREGLKKGDKVITAGGIYGTVKEIKERTLLIEHRMPTAGEGDPSPAVEFLSGCGRAISSR